MHLIESYAASSGLQIGKPYIYQKFVPVPFDKYITLHAGGGMPSKLYDYFAEVISLIRPTLLEHNYEIIQIGGKDDPAIANTIDLRGVTDIQGTAYLLNKCSLLLCNDSCNAHIASSFNKPVVALYGSTCPANHGPYFGDSEKHILLEPDRTKAKASFMSDEKPKTINQILPEVVAESVLKLLNIDIKVSRKSLFFGSQYGHFALEAIMDTLINNKVLPDAMIHARMDYHFNEDILRQNLMLRPYSIITNKPISIDLLTRMRGRIPLLVYNIDQDYSLDFIKNLLSMGIPYRISTFLEKEDLSEIKLELFDYGIILNRRKLTKDILENGDCINEKTSYKTYKFLLSKDKIYLNKYCWEQGKYINNFSENIDLVPSNCEDFFQDSDFYYYFNE